MNTYRAPIRCIICGDVEITSSEGTTQGNPLAMAMYALAVKPLIGKLKWNAPGVKQVWYADDATGAGTCDNLRMWWDGLQVHGAGYGYHPNASKTHLVVKAEHVERARELFADTEINITAEGKRHFSRCWLKILHRRICGRQGGEVVGRDQKVGPYCPDTTSCCLQCLHARSLESLLSRTIPDIADLLNPLEEAIQQHLIPALTGRPPCSKEERDLLALPIRLGGMGITNLASIHITTRLRSLNETNITHSCYHRHPRSGPISGHIRSNRSQGVNTTIKS